jgi:hypothetical protein
MAAHGGDEDCEDFEAHALICAWCGAVARGSDWGKAVERGIDAEGSHGICPECFGRLLPGTPYPRGRHDAP